MVLADKYELGQLIGGSTITVHKARTVTTGQSVLVHRLGGASAATVQALELALRYTIAHPGAGALLDVIDDGGCTYIVTADRADYISLVDWLLWTLSEPATVRFEGPGSGVSGDRGPAKGGLDSHLAYTAGVQRPGMATGQPQALAKPAVSSSTSPSEFTRIFQAVPNTASAPVRGLDGTAGQWTPAVGSQISWHSESKSSATGEFTRLFGTEKENPQADRSVPEPLPGPRTPPKPEPLYGSKAEQGEYTRLFRSDRSADADLAGHGEALYRASESGGTGQVASEQRSDLLGDPLSGTVTPQFSGGPSEYTRVIQTGGKGRDSLRAERPTHTEESAAAKPEEREEARPPALPNPVPQVRQPPLPAKPAEQPHRLLPVLIIMGAVLVAALILILIFVLRR